MKFRLPGTPRATPEIPLEADRDSRLAREAQRLAEALTRRDQALARERDLVQALLDTVGVMVLMLNARGNIILANRKVCEVLECDPERQCVGHNWFEHFLPEDERIPVRGVFECLMTGNAVPTEFHENHVLTCTGRRRLVAWHNSLLRDRAGRIVGTLSAGEDITERRRAEEALRRSEAWLRLAQEDSGVGFWGLDLGSGRVTVTPECERLLGIEPGRLKSHEDWRRLVHPDDLARRDTQYGLLVAQGREFEDEYRIVLPTGESRWMLSKVRALRDEQGRVARVMGVNVDITERKHMQAEQLRLQAQLQQAQKMEALGQLTGGIAHDFNNILASALGFARLARRRPAVAADGRLAEFLDEILAAGERARDLVAQMLAFGRSQTGSAAPALAPLPLAREAVKMLGATIPTSIRLETHFSESLPNIALDPVAFHQVLINLVINARDAVGEKGAITVTLSACRLNGQECSLCHERCSGEFLELAVADTGQGIAPEVLPRIFEPFFTTKPPGKGSGMGLAMVHGLVRGCGGHFRVESEPGRGSVFHVYLPLAKADNHEAGGSTPPPSGQLAGNGRRVLVVDDEPAILRLLAASLEAEGWQASAFADPQEALAAFRAAPEAYAALLTDHAMPEMTGMELIEAVHAHHPALPAILCTGYSEHLDEADALARGASRYFLKPVDSDILLSTLFTLLRREFPAS